jgi:plasmid maintenance system antidote protein VapI
VSYKVSPKEIIREELEARGWNVQTLAAEAGWTPKLAQEIVQGRAITRLVAMGLAQAFGTSEQLWVNLQAAYAAPAASAGLPQPVRGRSGRRPRAAAPVVPHNEPQSDEPGYVVIDQLGARANGEAVPA